VLNTEDQLSAYLQSKAGYQLLRDAVAAEMSGSAGKKLASAAVASAVKDAPANSQLMKTMTAVATTAAASMTAKLESEMEARIQQRVSEVIGEMDVVEMLTVAVTAGSKRSQTKAKAELAAVLSLVPDYQPTAGESPDRKAAASNSRSRASTASKKTGRLAPSSTRRRDPDATDAEMDVDSTDETLRQGLLSNDGQLMKAVQTATAAASAATAAAAAAAAAASAQPSNMTVTIGAGAGTNQTAVINVTGATANQFAGMFTVVQPPPQQPPAKK
jgi:hypothetical protein